MRIAVSGSHCSGKSTLIQDFLATHPEYVHEPEPYEVLTEILGEQLGEELEAADFYRQLEVSVERLSSYGSDSNVIAERSPFDFLAYLCALEELGRDTANLIEEAKELVRSALEHIDLLVVIPLNDEDGIVAGDDEDLELREAMDEQLRRIVFDDEFGLLSNGRLAVIEVSGTPAVRLAALHAAEVVARVNELALWDYEISTRDDHTLLMLGSCNFSYYHNLEIEFLGVTHCTLPKEGFSHAQFRIVHSGRDGLIIGVIAVSKTEIGDRDYEIRAASLVARFGTVYYYNRENLQPGEKIASWVKRDG